MAISKKDQVTRYNRDEFVTFALSQNLIARYVNINFSLTVPELHAKLRECKCNAFEAAIIAVLLKAIEDADHNRLDFLFSRLLGKVPNTIHIKEKSRFDEMTTDELVELKKQLDVDNAKTLRAIEAKNLTLGQIAAKYGIVEVKPKSDTNRGPEPEHTA